MFLFLLEDLVLPGNLASLLFPRLLCPLDEFQRQGVCMQQQLLQFDLQHSRLTLKIFAVDCALLLLPICSNLLLQAGPLAARHSATLQPDQSAGTSSAALLPL